MRVASLARHLNPANGMNISGRMAWAAACLLTASACGPDQTAARENPAQPKADAEASAQASQDASILINLKRGQLADYGATPWYTEDLAVGTSPMRFALDSGTKLLWATSDQCSTAACNAHDKVNTSQPGFSWVQQPQPPQEVHFGPWGSMGVWIGKAPFVQSSASLSTPLTFFASVDYEGEKFQHLAWGGGIGFPSESKSVTQTGFYFKALVDSGAVGASYSVYTDASSGTGAFILGAPDTSKYDPSTAVRLPPKKNSNPDLNYLWGTLLTDVQIAGTSLPPLQNQIFYLDTGSSRFKGDDTYVYPIMNQLLEYKDSQGNDIFVKYSETVQGKLTWTGLQYGSGGPADYPNLPDLSLTLGDTCGQQQGKQLMISLSPDQYSYKVDVGDRQGDWVVAVHRLDQVGGLLVGSTFMDLIYAAFTYERNSDDSLSQGDMMLFKTNQGIQPSGYQCVDANG